MAVEVRLTIVGLCLYVPGTPEDEDASVLHVLMPAHRTGGGQHEHDHHAHDDHHEPHRAVLLYDRAHHAPGEEPPGGRPYVQIPLDGCALQVRGGGGAAARPRVDPRQVAVLNEDVRFAGVDRSCAEVPLCPKVHARLELRGVRPPDVLDGYDWLGKDKRHTRCLVPVGKNRCGDESHTPPQYMAERVCWVLGTFDDGVTLPDVFSAVPQTVPPQLPPGRLRPRSGRVDLRIGYVVPAAIDGLGKEPVATAQGADHFPMFYDLASDVVSHEARYKTASDDVSIRQPSLECNSGMAVWGRS